MAAPLPADVIRQAGALVATHGNAASASVLRADGWVANCKVAC